MQQPTRNTPNKKTKYLDAKVLIATLSVAVTFGLWNIFSNEAVQAAKAPPAAQLAVPPQPPANAAQGFPPLPTLVPLANVNTTAGQAAPAGAAQVQNNSQAAGLRSVTAPSQVIQQKNKPLIDAPVLVSSSGGGGGRSGGSGPAPVTSTQSSRR